MIPRDCLERCARNYADKVAYHCGDRTETWAQIHARSIRLAEALRKLGVATGDVVAVLGQESIEIYEHFFACMHAGFVRVGINWRYAAPEAIHIIEDSAARVLLVDSRCSALFHEIRDHVRRAGIRTIGYGSGHECEYDYAVFLDQGAEKSGIVPVPGKPAEIASSDPLLITYTSGSTGKPKGVIHTHGSVLNIITQSIIARGLSPDDIWYTAAASSWMTIILNVQGIMNSMTHVIMDRAFEIRRFLRDIERRRATAVMLVPPLIARAIEETRSGSYDLTSLRVLMYGSSPASPELIQAAYDAFGCDMIQSYGMTEGGWVTQLSASDHRYAIENDPGLLKSVGRPGIMSELSIRDSDGAMLPDGASGEIWIHSEMLMRGYINLADETAAVLQDGWLRSNDIGRIDENGYLFLQDRKNLLIISGAVNVFPSSVEAILKEHDVVEQVVVVGAPHPEWGEAVVAVVRVKNGFAISGQELISFAQLRLSRMECPKHVLFVDDFPVTLTGKINKQAVKSWVAQLQDQMPWQAAITSG